MEFKAFKYRIYPSSDQEALLAQFFGAKRWIYNHYLHENQQRFANKLPLMSHYDINKQITELKKQEDTNWLKVVDDWALKHAAEDLHTAYSNFFNSIKGKRKGPKVDAPSFKSKYSRQSYRTRGLSCDFENGSIKLPKLKEVKCVFDREFEGKIKSATVSKTPSGKYFVSVLVEVETSIKPSTGKEVGIDLGLKDLCILSTGIKFEHPQEMLLKAKTALKQQQRILSRKKKGSKNYQRQRIRVARCYEKVTNIRNWYYHNVSTYLVNNFDAIYMEKLNVSGMMKNKKLSRKIQETAWSTLVNMIEYKSTRAGRTFYQIGRFEPSSKLCSSCGYKHSDLKLKDRSWICPQCGEHHDRDLNAAINIIQIGQKDCYGENSNSLETSELGEIPSSLQKHVSKIERSLDKSNVYMGSRNIQRSLDVE